MEDELQQDSEIISSCVSELEEVTQRLLNPGHFSTGKFETSQTPQQVLNEVSLEGIADYIKNGNCKNIIFMTGAGISTSAGLPDFRSEGTGLYEQLEEFQLTSPQRLMEIRYFKEEPKPFFTLVKEIYPGAYKPTPCHYFIRLMCEKNIVLRNYTQNIDALDGIAGIPEELTVEAHGNFKTAHCIETSCLKEHPPQWVKDEIFLDRIPKCDLCGGLVKPDLAFFGEDMPKWFDGLVAETSLAPNIATTVMHICDPLQKKDFPKCDMLIVMGTTLLVQPFAAMLHKVPATTPRLMINYEFSGKVDPLMKFLGTGVGFNVDYEDNYRDVFFLGACDDGCFRLAELLGWKNELEQLVRTEHQRLDVAAGRN